MLSFVLPPKDNDWKNLDCVISNVSLDQYHPDFEEWLQEVNKTHEIPLTLEEVHRRYTGWRDEFAQYVEDREEIWNLLETQDSRRTTPDEQPPARGSFGATSRLYPTLGE